MYQESQEDMEEEIFLQSLLEAGDEDAVIINDFEEAILTACQESAELAPGFASYQEARQCLRDKAKSRGFWPLGSGKGRTKGKKGKFGAPNKGSMSTNQQANFHRRSLRTARTLEEGVSPVHNILFVSFNQQLGSQKEL